MLTDTKSIRDHVGVSSLLWMGLMTEVKSVVYLCSQTAVSNYDDLKEVIRIEASAIRR